MSLYAGNALCHGIRYGNDGGVITNLSNIVVDSCEFSGLAFSIYITNNSTASIDGFTVRGCSFHDNYADDVNFNSPNGTFVGGQVIGNRFRNGLSTSNVGGFAIDFANVQNSLISDNIISDYPYNTIHLEDRTSHISITNNIMTNCAKLDESVIQIISGTTFVAITGNNFHQDDIEEGPRQSTAMIYVGPGSGAVTPGAITITGNNFSLSNMWHGIDAFSVARVVVSGNHFEGAGTVSNGVYTGGTNNAVGITNGGPAVVSGNYCFGMNSFIPGTTSAFRTMSGTITNNSVHQCNCGMDLKPTGSCIVTGNYFTNCVHSLVSGSNEVTIAQQAVIALNYAVGCANEMEATHDNFWGGVAETQRMVALNCDDSQGTVGFPIQRFLGSEIH
jgi:parallel beta-helix repeat protein